MTTPDFDLALPVDGQIPWGNDYRDAMSKIDQGMPFIRASMHILDNTTATVISAANTPVKANLPGTVGISPCGCLDFPGDNRMRYVVGSSPYTRTVTFTGSFSLDVAGNNQTIRVHLAKNDTVDPNVAITVRDLTSPPANGTIAGLVDISPGDYLEMWVQNLTSSNNVTITDVNMTIRG